MSYRLHILMFALLLMPFATADAGGPPEPEFEALIQMHKDMYAVPSNLRRKYWNRLP